MTSKMSENDKWDLHISIWLLKQGELSPDEEDIVKFAWKKSHDIRNGQYPKVLYRVRELIRRYLR